MRSTLGTALGLDQVNILLIEDSESDYQWLETLLCESGIGDFTLRWTRGAEDALTIVKKGDFHVCFLDYRLGLSDGLVVLQELVASRVNVPVIMLTGQGGLDVDILAMQHGAADFLEKDTLSPRALERSIRYTISNFLLQQQLRQLAEEDALTGMLNLRSFRQRVHEGVQRARRLQSRLGLIICDLDQFKKANELGGHSFGDHVLQVTSQRITLAAESSDIHSRIGEDKFAILCDVSTRQALLERGQALREALRHTMYTDDGQGFDVRASIGLACFPEDADGLEELQRQAEEALRQVKYEGGDGVRLCPFGGSYDSLDNQERAS